MARECVLGYEHLLVFRGSLAKVAENVVKYDEATRIPLAAVLSWSINSCMTFIMPA